MKAKYIKWLLVVLLDVFIILTPFYITGAYLNTIHAILVALWVISAITLVFKITDMKVVVDENEGFKLYFNILTDIGIILSWGWYYGDLVYGALIILVRLGILYRILEYRESEECNETENSQTEET